MNTKQSLPVGYKELRNELVKDALFPPGCSVVFDTKTANNNESFEIRTGTVQKAYYNARLEKMLYGIKTDDNNELFRSKKDLSFGINCPVEAKLNKKKEVGRIISPGQSDVDRYDAIFPTQKGYKVVENIPVDNIKYLPPSTPPTDMEVVVSGNSLTDNTYEGEKEEATTDQSLESDSNYSEEESEYDPNENASKEGNIKQGAAYMGNNTKGVYSVSGKYTSKMRHNHVLFHGGTTTLASDSAHRHDLLNDQLKIPNKQKHFPHLKDYQTARAKEIKERGLTNVESFESAKLQNKQNIEAQVAKKRAVKDTANRDVDASPQSEVSNERRYIGTQPTHAEETEKQPAFFKPGEDCSFWNVSPIPIQRKREGESFPSQDNSKRKREESLHSHPLQRKKAMSSKR